MSLSLSGNKMAKVSGLRQIMRDVATTMAQARGEDWIDLTIGNPARLPEVASLWQGLMAEALAQDFGHASCRYGQSRGNDAVLAAIAAYFNGKYGWSIGPENVVIAAGCQMLSFAAAALFTGPAADGMRRVVLPFEPDYTGYQSLSLHEDCVVGIPPRLRLRGDRSFAYELDGEALGRERKPGMLLMSDPANPTGRAATAEEMTAIVAVAEARDVPLLVDHAYGLPFPQVTTALVPPIWHPNVINCFSLSKAGLPGERIGFAVGAAKYTDAIASFVSNSIIHAPQLPQMVLKRALETGALDRIAQDVINPYYRRKQRVAEALLFETLPSTVPWRLHAGSGGMFCWLWIDHPRFDDERFYHRLKQKCTFIMPGRHFFASQARIGEHARRCLRISLSTDEAALARGIERVAEALTELGPT